MSGRTTTDRRPAADDGLAAPFSWETAAAALDGLPSGGLNIAHEAVDRHAGGRRSDHVALRYLHTDGTSTDRTYAQLRDDSSRFANVLAELGIAAGERVFSLLGRTPALHVAALGTLRHRAVFCPMFSAFGPDPVAQRVGRGDGVVLVTTAALFHRKVAPVLDQLPTLRHILLTDEDEHPDDPRCRPLAPLLAAADPHHEIGPTDPEDPALLHFTSGTTGTPKGAVHVHGAVLAHHVTAACALDLQPDDVYWCTADPGWVTGTSYGIVAPLSHGVTSLVDEGELDADRWYRTLQDHRVNVWYTAPTAIRMLMRADPPTGYDLSALRHVASVGEPLSPDAVRWGQRVLGLPVRDNWWQTETGGIMIANRRTDEVRPGSMGRPLPGIEATVLRRDEHGHVVLDHAGRPVEVDDPDEDGELALRRGWPSMFRGYLHETERYERCFLGDWYLSGDLARRDADGWFWFVGRADDVIKTAGHLIGPFEVEKVLNDHPAVVESGVIGVPDAVAGQRIKAFVVPAPGVAPTAELRRELLGFGRRHLGPVVAPKDVAFARSLPHTRSGKVMRRLLRARELGEEAGDTSTLEDGS